jgi:hypothetical protein
MAHPEDPFRAETELSGHWEICVPVPQNHRKHRVVGQTCQRKFQRRSAGHGNGPLCEGETMMQNDVGYISRRNEDGTAWYSVRNDLGSWASKDGRTLCFRETFDRLLAGQDESIRKHGFMGNYDLKFHVKHTGDK